jgi:putative acetyltransferase
MNIILGDFKDEQVKALLTRHLRGMHENSPAEFVFALDWSALQSPDIVFFTAWEGDDLLGCGALKALGDGTGEIKSMRTADTHLRKGVGAALLQHLIALARERRYHALFLETGSGPAFHAATTLYQKHDFVFCDAFGHYQPSAFSQFMRLSL